MKILAAKLQKLENFDNTPTIQILVDKIPEVEYQEKNGCYFGEKDGYANFMFHCPQNERGYAGRVFDLKMTDGTIKSIKGPWSGNSKSMHAAGFPQTVDVQITESEKDFNRGYTFYSGHLTIDKFKEAAKLAGCIIGLSDGFYVAMPRCNCGSSHTYKYRILKENDRKYLCKMCSCKYLLDINPVSFSIDYSLQQKSNLVSNTLSREQSCCF
jgi:hypothetical protein